MPLIHGKNPYEAKTSDSKNFQRLNICSSFPVAGALNIIQQPALSVQERIIVRYAEQLFKMNATKIDGIETATFQKTDLLNEITLRKINFESAAGKQVRLEIFIGKNPPELVIEENRIYKYGKDEKLVELDKVADKEIIKLAFKTLAEIKFTNLWKTIKEVSKSKE